MDNNSTTHILMVCIPIYTKIGDGYYCSAHILSQEVPPSPEENDHPTFVGTVSEISQGKIWKKTATFGVDIWGSKIDRYIYISVYNIYNLYEYQIYMDSLGVINL